MKNHLRTLVLAPFLLVAAVAEESSDPNRPVLDKQGTLEKQTFHVTLESMPPGAAEGDIVLHEESLNRGSVIRNCSTSNVGTEYSSTRFRCVDLIFENKRAGENFEKWVEIDGTSTAK